MANTAMSPCEVCGRPGEMDFNALLPSFGVIVKGDVCFECFEDADGDMEIAVSILKTRAGQRGVALPTDAAGLASLASKVDRG